MAPPKKALAARPDPEPTPAVDISSIYVMRQTDHALVMPPRVAAAIIEVMSTVQKLEKKEENKHGHYKYAGIDSYLDEVRPLSAAAGLIVTQNCIQMEFRDAATPKGPETWVCCEFEYSFAHASGETWLYRPRNWAMARASMGSQAMGTAEAYGMKNMHRMTFKIATGENLDVDTQAPGNLPRGRTTKPAGTPQSAKAEPAEAEPPYTTDVSQMMADRMIDDIGEKKSGDEISAYATEHAKVFKRMTPEDIARIKSASAAMREQLLTGDPQTRENV